MAIRAGRVRPDHGGGAPSFQVLHLQLRAESYSFPRLLESIAQIHVLDRREWVAGCVKSPNLLKVFSSDCPAGTPECGRLRFSILVNKVMKKIAVLREEIGFEWLVVVRAENGRHVRLVLKDACLPGG